MSYAVDVKNLTKRFQGHTIVDHIGIRLPCGQICGFLGPNGGGKTTTIRMLCGLLRPDEGEGVCLGLDLGRDADKIRSRTGYMTQKFSFWEDLTVRENLEFVAKMFAMNHVEDRLRECLRNFGLTLRADQLAGELSGGWRQRLALAACILHEPELLLLDEPTAGVDPKSRREFWNEIKEFTNRGLTTLVSTHYMDEAERCDKIIYIADGHIVAEGSAGELMEKSGAGSLEESFIYYIDEVWKGEP
ncbi:MAG: ABC transporter ATP-binding protein [Holosporaceae bacterium]|jgi:ABC-2 type transport system ATP-binding protein|nr:ABC transporter ATP-binding protein [Holosporaceae bacterium]